MLFKKEKEVIAQIRNYVGVVVNCLQLADDTLNAYLTGDIQTAKKLSRDVDTTENEADLIRYDIRNKLYSGAYLPMLREDIYKLVESIDKVANAGEACCDFFLNQRPEIPADLTPSFQFIIREAFGIRELLKKAILCYLEGEKQVDNVRRHAKSVHQQESEVDRMEWDLTKEIFTSKLDFCRKLHLKQCLDVIVEVADRAENSADQLELVTLKSMS